MKCFLLLTKYLTLYVLAVSAAKFAAFRTRTLDPANSNRLAAESSPITLTVTSLNGLYKQFIQLHLIGIP